METHPVLIRTRSLCFAYPGEGTVLSDISLDLPAGRTLCLAGVNGSGKSTLLSVMAGIFPPETAASLHFGGQEATRKMLRAHTRLVLQDPDLSIIGATVGEDLCLDADPADGEALELRRAMARRMALLDRWDDPVHILSHGQKRKVCLASALSGLGPDPSSSILLLDEPFSGLDYPASRELRAILAAERKRGAAMVIATHDLEPVLDICDTVALLDKGRVALSGTPAEVLDHVEEHGVRTPCSWRFTRTIRPWEDRD